MLKKNLFSTFETVDIEGEELYLLPEKAIYWKKKEKLLIADLHIGKTTHFRNNGIAVPKKAEKKNLKTLHHLLAQVKPKCVCFLGDLFHSVHNEEWTIFTELIKSYPKIKFELVVGNHDILAPQLYKDSGITIFKEKKEFPFLLTHEPIEKGRELYNLSGHIHPGVKLKGKGKLAHRAPCFFFGKNYGILPAFGSFTGLATLNVKKEDRVFIIVGDEVIAFC